MLCEISIIDIQMLDISKAKIEKKNFFFLKTKIGLALYISPKDLEEYLL